MKSNLITSYIKKQTLQFVGYNSIKTGEEESSGNVDCFVHCRKKNIIGCPEDNFSTTAHHQLDDHEHTCEYHHPMLLHTSKMGEMSRKKRMSRKSFSYM